MVEIHIHHPAQHVVGLAVNEIPPRLRILLTAGVPTEADLVGPDPTRRHVRDLLQDLRCPECVSLPFINFFTVMQLCVHDRL